MRIRYQIFYEAPWRQPKCMGAVAKVLTATFECVDTTDAAWSAQRCRSAMEFWRGSAKVV
jgi:hypothetical protein